MACAQGIRVRLVAPGRRRDVGRSAERHQRLSRDQGACVRGARQRAGRSRHRRQRRRRDWHDLQSVQGRYRHGVATAPRGPWGVHDRCPRAMQLWLARLGVGRLGGTGGNPSGDIFVAFSTANPGAARPDANVSVTMLPNERIDPLFAATIQATEEAIVNAMVAAETMTGINGMRVYALPHDRLRAALRKYNRLVEPRR